MAQSPRSIIISLNEAEYLAMRKLVSDAILMTPSGKARNLLTEVNIKLMRDADASGFSHLVNPIHDPMADTRTRARMLLTIEEMVTVALREGEKDDRLLYEAAHNYNREHDNALPDEWVNNVVSRCIRQWLAGGKA